MGLLSFLKRGDAAPAAKPVADAADAVQQLRLRARRRLIGAAVLVVIGVIGFPLVFETQPRPIPVDLPIEIPRKEAAPPLQIPAPQSLPATLPPASEAPAAQSAVAHAPTPAPVVARAEPAEVIEPPVARPAERVAEKPVEKPVEKPAERKVEKPADKPTDKPVERAAEKKPSAAEAARVQALLEGKGADRKAAEAAGATGNGRFIVQVGAYADAKAAHEARMKVEKLGLKTYTQAVETADGKRIRVRVGPFASRDEADKVAAKVRGGGLSTAVLTL